jgi:integrase
VAGRPPAASTSVASTAVVAGPLLAAHTGGRLDQAAPWHLVRRLARAAGIEHWAALSPHSLRHTAITLALDAGATCRISPDTATRERLGVTTGPATAWTATPPTPSPPTWPDARRSPRVARLRGGWRTEPRQLHGF